MTHREYIDGVKRFMVKDFVCPEPDKNDPCYMCGYKIPSPPKGLFGVSLIEDLEEWL